MSDGPVIPPTDEPVTPTDTPTDVPVDVPVTPVDTPVVKQGTDPRQQIAISNRMGEIIAQYGGESNIPVGPHEYWGLRNKLQNFRNS